MTIETVAISLQGEMVDFTKRLISIRTVNPPGDHYADAVRFLTDECRSLGLSTRSVTVPMEACKAAGVDPSYPRISLIAEHGKGRTVHLNGHFDVVPATSGWKADPFKAVVKGTRIYGRGTADMKGNIASMLFAFRILREAGIQPRARVQYSFVPDEETGGRLGFRYLVENDLVKADFVIGEGHSTKEVSYGSKGLLWLMVEVIGKSSHAAYAYKGRNAFEYAVKLATELDQLKIQVEKRKSSHSFSDESQKHPTFVLGGLSTGGTKINTVPDKVSFSIDRRLIPEETVVVVREEIARVVKRFAQSNPEVKVNLQDVADDAPVIVATSNPLMQGFTEAVRKVHGSCSFKLLSGGTDPRWLLRKGIPGVGYTPVGGNMHSDNEWVDIRSMVKTAIVYSHFLASL